MGGRLQGKTAIIVGAGQAPGEGIGNGRAISILFAREGAKVLLVDNNPDSAMETKSLIDEEGGQSVVFQADIISEADCCSIAEKCIDSFGKIDILVNNVGIGDNDNNISDLKTEDWDRIMDVNLRGMFLICKYVIPHMEKQQSGAIINISAAGAVCTMPVITYPVSKAGVNALTHQLAMAYAPKGIRVNSVMLGLMSTPMVYEIYEKMGYTRKEAIEFRDSLVPLKGGQGDAWDTANACVFLASDEAKFITSVYLPVDGGTLGKIG